MADKSALRRWKPFFPAFGAIDASIEAAAAAGCSRDKYRQVRGDIVELLCDAAGDADGGGRAEELCGLLDVAMAEALETLRAVPVTPAMLTTTGVAKAVGGLLRHESGEVRSLARAVLSGWRASMEAALRTLLQVSCEHGEVVAAAGAPPPVTGCGGPAPDDDRVRNEETTRGEGDAAKRKHAARKGQGMQCKAQTDDVERQRTVVPETRGIRW